MCVCVCACRCYLRADLHNIYLMVSYDVAYVSVRRANYNLLFKFTFELSLCLIGKPFFTCVVSFDFIVPLLVNSILRPNDTTISEELVIKKSYYDLELNCLVFTPPKSLKYISLPFHCISSARNYIIERELTEMLQEKQQ